MVGRANVRFLAGWDGGRPEGREAKGSSCGLLGDITPGGDIGGGDVAPS